MARSVRLLWVAVLVVLAVATRTRAELPAADPASLGFDADRLKRIDGAIDRAVERRQVPGAVVLVGRRGSIAYARAAGRRVVGPAPEAMTRDTVFDMASLTKPVATATSVMILIEEGRLRLTDRLGRTLPAFDNHGKGAITIDQLLRHRAGLIPDNPIADYQQWPRSGLETPRRARPRRPARRAVPLFRRGIPDPGKAGGADRRATASTSSPGSGSSTCSG